MTGEETYNEMISKTEIPEMPDRLIKQSFEALENNYDIAQRAKMEATHNAIIAAINDQQARPEHVLLVLEIVRNEIVNNCMNMFFAPPPPSSIADPTQVKDGDIETI